MTSIFDLQKLSDRDYARSDGHMTPPPPVDPAAEARGRLYAAVMEAAEAHISADPRLPQFAAAVADAHAAYAALAGHSAANAALARFVRAAERAGEE